MEELLKDKNASLFIFFLLWTSTNSHHPVDLTIQAKEKLLDTCFRQANVEQRLILLEIDGKVSTMSEYEGVLTSEPDLSSNKDTTTLKNANIWGDWETPSCSPGSSHSGPSESRLDKHPWRMSPGSTHNFLLFKYFREDASKVSDQILRDKSDYSAWPSSDYEPEPNQQTDSGLDLTNYSTTFSNETTIAKSNRNCLAPDHSSSLVGNSGPYANEDNIASDGQDDESIFSSSPSLWSDVESYDINDSKPAAHYIMYWYPPEEIRRTDAKFDRRWLERREKGERERGRPEMKYETIPPTRFSREPAPRWAVVERSVAAANYLTNCQTQGQEIQELREELSKAKYETMEGEDDLADAEFVVANLSETVESLKRHNKELLTVDQEKQNRLEELSLNLEAQKVPTQTYKPSDEASWMGDKSEPDRECGTKEGSVGNKEHLNPRMSKFPARESEYFDTLVLPDPDIFASEILSQPSIEEPHGNMSNSMSNLSSVQSMSTEEFQYIGLDGSMKRGLEACYEKASEKARELTREKLGAELKLKLCRKSLAQTISELEETKARRDSLERKFDQEKAENIEKASVCAHITNALRDSLAERRKMQERTDHLTKLQDESSERNSLLDALQDELHLLRASKAQSTKRVSSLEHLLEGSRERQRAEMEEREREIHDLCRQIKSFEDVEMELEQERRVVLALKKKIRDRQVTWSNNVSGRNETASLKAEIARLKGNIKEQNDTLKVLINMGTEPGQLPSRDDLEKFPSLESYWAEIDKIYHPESEMGDRLDAKISDQEMQEYFDQKRKETEAEWEKKSQRSRQKMNEVFVMLAQKHQRKEFLNILR